MGILIATIFTLAIVLIVLGIIYWLLTEGLYQCMTFGMEIAVVGGALFMLGIGCWTIQGWHNFVWGAV